MRHVMIAAALAVAGTLAAPAEAVSIGKVYAFGDSLNDCCRNGGPFNNGNETWLPAFAGAVGGTYTENAVHNYAVGGAEAGPDNAVPQTDDDLGYDTGFTSQAARFKAAAPATGTDDLGVLWVGTNDIWASASDADLLFGVIPFNRPVGKQPTAGTFVSQTIATMKSGIADLKAGGIEKLLILTPYDIGEASLVISSDAEKSLATDYSQALRDALMRLYTPGLDTWVLDTVGVIQSVQSTAPFPLSTNPCGLTASPGLCDDYVFNDFIHFTDATNAIVAAEAAALVNTGAPLAPIPLPAPVAMLATALAGLIVVRGRKASA